MGKAEKERLNQTLSRHISNIHETLQVLLFFYVNSPH
uniref:Uncharacterized protein n=1 Tax=Rhizophora mucronata TaxID=61149 RepID=A0A2P2JSL1_RHIMU